MGILLLNVRDANRIAVCIDPAQSFAEVGRSGRHRRARRFFSLGNKRTRCKCRSYAPIGRETHAGGGIPTSLLNTDSDHFAARQQRFQAGRNHPRRACCAAARARAGGLGKGGADRLENKS